MSRFSSFFIVVLLLWSTLSTANQAAPLANPELSYPQAAQVIRTHYESQLFSLPLYQQSHYGLRLYRQTQSPRYHTLLWLDMARISNTLNYFASEVHTPEQIQAYSQRQLAKYQQGAERKQLRYQATKDHVEYLYLGLDLLAAMARANELGLQHQQDALLRQVLRGYDFKPYVTEATMIRAWAAQQANHVYWLRQLGEQDLVAEFTRAFQQTYPDEGDSQLSRQQYANKIYGMTHIIFADSGYYQRLVSPHEHQWIYDYFRRHIDTILQRCKNDVIAEVGISFLLAGLADDPVVAKTRQALLTSLDVAEGMIPADDGDFDLSSGEHRNVLAIMLLDWQGVAAVPHPKTTPQLYQQLPYGLELKRAH